MSKPLIRYCPGTLTPGHETYSTTCLRHVFDGRKVSHILPYPSPLTEGPVSDAFVENQKRMSISGVQQKFSVVLDKNKLRLTTSGERGMYILKPISPGIALADQLPANEHLTMQIARQLFSIETAENALIFFNDGQPAYITRRFDRNRDGHKLASQDFASLAGLTPYKDGDHYKYLGCYLDLFLVMKKYLPIYAVESLKLFRLIVFNYLFSNGDAHHKNFSILETTIGDFRLSPAYDLLNTRLHIPNDTRFALVDGLLPTTYAQDNIKAQFKALAQQADLPMRQYDSIMSEMLSRQYDVEAMIHRSFLSDAAREKYFQHFKERMRLLAG